MVEALDWIKVDFNLQTSIDIEHAATRVLVLPWCSSTKSSDPEPDPRERFGTVRFSVFGVRTRTEPKKNLAKQNQSIEAQDDEVS
jgi:hypothetical protein